MTRVGWIGLGAMGSPMAACVARGGFDTTAFDIDPARAASQDAVNRPYYRSLQGMRVRLADGIATGGGTTKFRDVYVRPGSGPFSRLFRKNSPAAVSTPWSDAPGSWMPASINRRNASARAARVG